MRRARGRLTGSGIQHCVHFVLLLGIGILAYHHPFEQVGSVERLAQDSNRFVRGDSNDDGLMDLSDAINTLSFLFVGLPPPPCRAAADVNDDGVLDLSDAVAFLDFLFKGGEPPVAPYPLLGLDPTPDLGCRDPELPDVPPVGSPGGPDRFLTEAERLSWQRGRLFFDLPATLSQGLGPFFNGDSCVSCHLDPVIGGAGGLDVDVVRFTRIEDDVIVPLSGEPAVSRHSILNIPREECPPETNVIETRQTPTIFGLGLVDRIPQEVLLANEDPDDLDGDGISGRARLVGMRVGRFGHKAGVPSMRDFAADALFNEIGLTINGNLSTFAGTADLDAAPDPELSDETFEDLVFFLSHLAAPERVLPTDPDALARVNEGEALFDSVGCAACHVPALEGADGPVAAYSDFLLHDVGDPTRYMVVEPGVESHEFRTAPLWGVRDTAPYLHDGSAERLEDAVRNGHYGEANEIRLAFLLLSPDEREKVIEFLRSL